MASVDAVYVVAKEWYRDWPEDKWMNEEEFKLTQFVDAYDESHGVETEFDRKIRLQEEK